MGEKALSLTSLKQVSLVNMKMFGSTMFSCNPARKPAVILLLLCAVKTSSTSDDFYVIFHGFNVVRGGMKFDYMPKWDHHVTRLGTKRKMTPSEAEQHKGLQRAYPKPSPPPRGRTRARNAAEPNGQLTAVSSYPKGPRRKSSRSRSRRRNGSRPRPSSRGRDTI